MSARLPLFDQRSTAPRPALTDRPKVVVPRGLVCVIGDGAERGASSALQFASGLVRALSARAVPVAALIASEEASAEQFSLLREAGAEPVLALGQDALQTDAGSALERLPRACVVIGFGAAVNAALQPLLAIRIAPPSRLDGSIDLELPRDCPLVAAAIAETLARQPATSRAPDPRA